VCRVLGYLGEPLLIDHLLYQPDNSLIKQSYKPKFMSSRFSNLAGFGMFAWNNNSYNPEEPFFYRNEHLPFYDANLKQLALKLEAKCLLAHVRGVHHTHNENINYQNTHPFLFPNTKLAIAHNGELQDFINYKMELMQHMLPAIAMHIKGSTDSEIIAGLIISQLVDPYANPDPCDVVEALQKTFSIIRTVRKKNAVSGYSPVNMFITNGEYIITSRFAYDFGNLDIGEEDGDYIYQSLWCTYGGHYTKVSDEYKMMGLTDSNSVIIASEPLTKDTSTWIEVPEYSISVLVQNKARVEFTSIDVTV